MLVNRWVSVSELTRDCFWIRRVAETLMWDQKRRLINIWLGVCFGYITSIVVGWILLQYCGTLLCWSCFFVDDSGHVEEWGIRPLDEEQHQGNLNLTLRFEVPDWSSSLDLSATSRYSLHDPTRYVLVTTKLPHSSPCRSQKSISLGTAQLHSNNTHIISHFQRIVLKSVMWTVSLFSTMILCFLLSSDIWPSRYLTTNTSLSVPRKSSLRYGTDVFSVEDGAETACN